MRKYFGIENFDGEPLPENWDEICDFLNERYNAGENADDVWNKYWDGAYDDAPEAVLLFNSHNYDDLVKICAKGIEYEFSGTEITLDDITLDDIKEEMRNNKIYDVIPEDQFERFCEAVYRKMKKITAKDVAEYIFNSDTNRVEDGMYYVHVNDEGNFVNSFREGATFTEPVDLTGFENDEDLERFYTLFENLHNEEFMEICRKLANQINKYLEEVNEE